MKNRMSILHWYRQQGPWCYWIWYCKQNMKPHKRLYHQCLKKNKSLTTVQRERERQKSSSSQPTRGYNAQAQIKRPTQYQIYIRGYANLTCKLTTKFDRGFTDRNHLANAIVSSFWNQAHVQCIISVSFILDCRVGQSITNGKSLLTI